MNYFINFIPKTNIFDKINKLAVNLEEDNIIFNIYIKNLPAMNIDKNIYCDFDKVKDYILNIKKRKFKVNIMIDTFCFGNREFTTKGKKILEMLDKIFELNIDYITITNNFFFNYVKRRHTNVKIIMSEYSEIINVQKICRYLEDMKADGVKLDLKLCLKLDKMQYIKDNFNVNNIHIDMSKVCYENDIFKDSFNNGISHLIQEEKWGDIDKYIKEYENKQNITKNKKIFFAQEDFNKLKDMGFKNFWCNNEILL